MRERVEVAKRKAALAAWQSKKKVPNTFKNVTQSIEKIRITIVLS